MYNYKERENNFLKKIGAVDKLAQLEAELLAKDNITCQAHNERNMLDGNGYIVSWCIGHLVGLALPEVYSEDYKKWDNLRPSKEYDKLYASIKFCG